jgi:glycosyltransferase involved in cell wall biosynthesis
MTSPSTVLVHLADLRRSRTDSHGIINFSLGLTLALPDALGAGERLLVVVNDELAPELADLMLRPGDVLEVVAAPTTPLRRLWLDNVDMARRGRHVGVVLYPKGFLPAVGRARRAAHVAVFHDDIPFRMLRGRSSLARRLRALYFSGSLLRSVRAADGRCFVSGFTAGRLQRLGGGPRRGDRVVYEGITLPSRPYRPLEQRSRTALVLGSAHVHKRIGPGLRLARGSAPLREAIDEIVVVGPVPGELDPAPGMPVRHRPGPIGSAELAELYATCRVVLYPSDYEGFGLPPVEALAMGTPVVRRATPAGDEVLGPVPGRYGDEAQGAFDAAVREVLAMTDDELLAAQARMWSTYDWSAVAERVATALREARADRAGRRPRRAH